MMRRPKENELRALSHLAMVITVIGFSAVLILLNMMMGWEKWTIPLCVVAGLGCFFMHVLHRPLERQRIFIYSIILMVEMFYYSVNVDTLYDCTPVIAVVIVLVCMTQESVLTVASIITGYAGMIYHLIAMHQTVGIDFTPSNVIRAIWHFLLVAIVAVIATRLVAAVDRLSEGYESRIKKLGDENKSAGDFLANVSHEIRTPINAVIGLTGVVMEQEKDPNLRKSLQSVAEAGKRVAEQISDILDYSEIDMKKLAVNTEDYMLSSLLNDLVLEIQPIKPRDLELVIDVDPALPAIMRTDVTKLRKILWHLITNGLKYTKEGGVYVRISPIRQEYGMNLYIEVEDTGIGMTEAEMERVFDRFYQGDSGRTRSTNGLGLGMAIVSGFTSALGGFFTISSKPGVGTRVHVSIPQEVRDTADCMSVRNHENLCLGAYLHFEKYSNPSVREYYNMMIKRMVQGLKLPMHRVETLENLEKLLSTISFTHLFVAEEEYLTDPDLMEELAHKMVVIVVANPGFPLRPGTKIRLLQKPFYCFPVISALNITSPDEIEEEGRMYCRGVKALVVDDEPMNLTVAIGILDRYGIIVTTAPSGQDAIKLCKEQEFDIVFMDHMMPEMDGIEAMHRIRNEMEIERKILPIVALTANAVSTAKEMFLNEGFDGFVSKPIELTELERVLKKVLPRAMVTYETSGSVTAAGSGTAAPAVEEPRQEDAYAGLVRLGIETRKGLHYCQDDEEFYRTLLNQFASDGKGKREEAAAFYADQDWKNYAIIVHALKSTAKMIGAMTLSDQAKTLEDAAKREQEAFITENHHKTMQLYETVSEGILTWLGQDTAMKAGTETMMSAGKEEDNEAAILEFSPEKPSALEEVLEFSPEAASMQEEVLEFSPEDNPTDEEEILEFTPEEGS